MADSENKAMETTEKEEVEEIEAGDGDGEEEAGDGDQAAAGDALTSAEMASQLMQNPKVLAALQSRLGSMVGTPSGYIDSLPKVVKRRIKALKKLQFEMIKIESKFYDEVHELECKYAAQYAPLFDRRREIVGGNIEPTDSDCEWPSDEESDDDENELKGKATVKEVDETKETKEGKDKDEEKEKEETKDENALDEDTKGIPDFWLTAFKNVNMLADMVQDHDEPILKHLRDIKVKFSQGDSMGFSLEFHFDANDFFTNTVLTKEYTMRCEPDEGDPFAFEGPEIIKCKGCTIDWKKGKNVTVKVVKKTQKHKGRGTKRTVTKTVHNDSFFNFFTPPDVQENEEPDADVEELLAADFEIGHFIRERLVPRSVLYFTGEALMDEDEFDDEEGEEEEDDEDYDEDADGDYTPGQGVKGGNPQECKQQ